MAKVFRSGSFRCVVTVLVATLVSACVVLRPAGYEAFQQSLKQDDPMEIYDTLEALIAEDDDTRTDRNAAFKAIKDRKDDTAAFHFAWAAIAGRRVQAKGLLAANLLPDIEQHARRSVELDPKFRNGAARRLLGTLYVVAPSSFVEHGDSEVGLEMLLELVNEYPQDVENHLRVAEAYISLGDPQPAAPHLCACLAAKDNMRKDDQKLLTSLVADAGPFSCSGVPIKASMD
jgi:hypothetical protein